MAYYLRKRNSHSIAHSIFVIPAKAGIHCVEGAPQVRPEAIYPIAYKPSPTRMNGPLRMRLHALLGVVHSRVLERDIGLPGGSRLRRAWVSMSGEAGNPHTGLEIGETLRRAREKRGLSLQQVEEATKIRTRYLRDLENENFDVLPAVYMLGSLKTYAAHLGLDGTAMTSELKRRQTPLRAEQERAREDPPSREPRGFLASVGRLLGIGETVEDEAGTMPDPVHSPRLHVSLVVVLVFVLVTALMSILEREERLSVSQVREPKSSQIPSMLALSSDAIVDKPYTEGGNVEYQPERQARTPARDAGKDDEVDVGGSAQGKYAPRTAQTLSSATASASAPASASAGASASASPASTGPSTSSASAPATTTPVPTRVRPEPAARKQPDDAGRAKAVALPDAPLAPAPGGRDLRPGFQRKQAGSVDSTRKGDRTSTKVKVFARVKKTVSFAR